MITLKDPNVLVLVVHTVPRFHRAWLEENNMELTIPGRQNYWTITTHDPKYQSLEDMESLVTAMLTLQDDEMTPEEIVSYKVHSFHLSKDLRDPEEEKRKRRPRL